MSAIFWGVRRVRIQFVGDMKVVQVVRTTKGEGSRSISSVAEADVSSACIDSIPGSCLPLKA